MVYASFASLERMLLNQVFWGTLNTAPGSSLTACMIVCSSSSSAYMMTTLRKDTSLSGAAPPRRPAVGRRALPRQERRERHLAQSPAAPKIDYSAHRKPLHAVAVGARHAQAFRIDCKEKLLFTVIMSNQNGLTFHPPPSYRTHAAWRRPSRTPCATRSANSDVVSCSAFSPFAFFPTCFRASRPQFRPPAQRISIKKSALFSVIYRPICPKLQHFVVRRVIFQAGLVFCRQAGTARSFPSKTHVRLVRPLLFYARNDVGFPPHVSLVCLRF